MKKIKAKIKVNDYIIEDIGIIENDILKVKDNNTELTFDYNNLVLTRNNEEIEIKIDFKKKEVLYNLKPEKKSFSTNLIIFSLTNHDKQVIIKYQIEETNFFLDIMHETI